MASPYNPLPWLLACELQTPMGAYSVASHTLQHLKYASCQFSDWNPPITATITYVPDYLVTVGVVGTCCSWSGVVWILMQCWSPSSSWPWATSPTSWQTSLSSLASSGTCTCVHSRCTACEGVCCCVCVLLDVWYCQVQPMYHTAEEKFRESAKNCIFVVQAALCVRACIHVHCICVYVCTFRVFYFCELCWLVKPMKFCLPRKFPLYSTACEGVVWSIWRVHLNTNSFGLIGTIGVYDVSLQFDYLCDCDEALRGGQHLKEVSHNHQILSEDDQVSAWVNSLPTIRNSLKKQKPCTKV